MKKRVIALLLGMVLTILKPIEIYASEKTVELELDKDYTACVFEINFSESGMYEAVIMDENGNTYNYERISDTKMSCSVEKVKMGSYRTVIKSDSEEEIGKVTLSVSTEAVSDTSVVDSNIEVGKDIAGLQMYFKNNTLNISWTDDTCGKVNVKVVNLDNSQTIANEKVDDKDFSCEVEESIEKIMVEIVPTESMNVSGAEISFSLENGFVPNAYVEFPSTEFFNLDMYPVTLQLNEIYGISCEVNGAEVLQYENLEVGEHKIEIPLGDDGNKEIAVYFIDSSGNMKSFNSTCYKDTVGPTIKFKEEYDGITVNDESIDIIGTVSDFSTLTMNGEEVEVATDGQFTTSCNLHIGENHLEVVANDSAGNQTVYSITVNMVEKTTSINWQLILVLIAVIGIMFYSKIKKKKVNGIKVDSNKNILKLDKENVFSEEDDEVEEEDEVEDDDKKSTCEEKHAIIQDVKHLKKEIVSSLNTNPTKRENVKKSNKWNTRDIIKIFVPAIVVVIIFKVILLTGIIPSESMAPTLQVGDVIVTNKLAYIAREPQRGDVITFFKDDELYVKRIIGVEGDNIHFVDGYVYVNGNRLVEIDYLDEDIETNCIADFLVPNDCVFVLGDNRENSLDSRFWEEPYVTYKDIEGKVLFTLPTHVFR